MTDQSRSDPYRRAYRLDSHMAWCPGIGWDEQGRKVCECGYSQQARQLIEDVKESQTPSKEIE